MRLLRRRTENQRHKSAAANLVVDTGRVEAFSDGVMAIAITLLSLELRLPDTQQGGLLDALASIWPQFVGFIVSFLLIGQVWLNHHSVFQHLKKVNQGMLVWNLLLLLDVAFLPFATRVLTTCLESGEDPAAGSVVYGGSMFVGGLCFNALWRMAVADGDNIKPGVSQAEIEVMTRRFRRGPLLYLLASGMGALNIWLAIGTYTALIVYYMFDSKSGLKSR